MTNSQAVKLYPLRDTSTMLRRNVRQEMRDKVAIAAIIGIPVLFLLLFVYVFGGALKGSVQRAGTPAYVDFVLPGLIIMTAAAGLIGISTQTSVDMTVGIIDRFRTMAIFRPAILIARVVASALQTLVAMVVVFGIAFAVGFRSPASPRSGWARPGCSRSSPSPWPGWAWPSAWPPRPSPRPATGRSR